VNDFIEGEMPRDVSVAACHEVVQQDMAVSMDVLIAAHGVQRAVRGGRVEMTGVFPVDCGEGPVHGRAAALGHVHEKDMWQFIGHYHRKQQITRFQSFMGWCIVVLESLKSM